jgi:hypothetical protein
LASRTQPQEDPRRQVQTSYVIVIQRTRIFNKAVPTLAWRNHR